MKSRDTLMYAIHSLRRSPSRTALMLLAMGIGVAAVVLLTGLGEASRRYVINEFASLGTNLVIVLPGKSETAGGTLGASMGGTTRDLTIDDALAVSQHHLVKRVSPIVIGAAGIKYAGREREAPVYGATKELLEINHWRMESGQFLPHVKWFQASPVCVIGGKLESELFGRESAIGKWLRIGENRFRVVGVLDDSGQAMGVAITELVVVPVASALNIFNTESLFRILIESTSAETIGTVRDFAEQTIKDRHHGEEDVTVITQDAILKTFDQIFNALTATIGGIGAISLAVAGILIMNVMLVAVAQRTSEIGLLKAIGAGHRQVITLFLAESALLSLFGAIIGLGIGYTVGWIISSLFPRLNMAPPLWAVIAGVVMALVAGILFGIMPARRAAALDPVIALSKA